MAQGCPQSQATNQFVIKDWRRIIQSLYLDLEHRTYCVPPVYFNRVPFERAHFAGQPVHVLATCQLECQPPPCQTTPPMRSRGLSASHGQSASPTKTAPLCEPATAQESGIGEDFAQQHVLLCLQKLGEGLREPMFVISQLNYADYLNKPLYAQAVQHFPRPADLPREDRRGDFDLLIVHQNHGILIGEIKSVGLKRLNKTQEQFDSDVSRRVQKAVKQLDKSEKVIEHIFHDIPTVLSVKKTLILPYVTSNQLQRVLTADKKLEQEVCRSLVATDAADAVQLCLCADQLSSRDAPHDVTQANLSALKSWLQGRMSGGLQMSRDVYIDVLARIVGPATSVCVHCVSPPRVEVRTLGEAVSELGERMAFVMLTPQQLNLLIRAQDLPMVCLVGPPGTGKSLVLVLVGLHWLRSGHDVLVTSTDYEALAASRMICHQLEKTLQQTHGERSSSKQSPVGTVSFLYFNLDDENTDEEASIRSLVRTSTRHVIVDEANFYDKVVGPRLRRVVAELKTRIPGLCLWAATLSDQHIPEELQVEPLTVPLRSSPVVVREVEAGLPERQIRSYSTSGAPSHSDGPKVIRLRHEGGQHTGDWPVECDQCGLEVADVLIRTLKVGVTGSATTTTTTTTTIPGATTTTTTTTYSNNDTTKTTTTKSTTSGNTTTTTSPPPLRYREVVVLTRSSELRDDVTDDAGNMTSPACGFVSALRDAGVPVCVIREDDGDPARWEDMAADLAVAGEDHVTVAHYSAVSGLERKVVVVLQGRYQGYDDNSSREQVENEDRILAMSRCSAQLVTVEVPPSDKDSDKQGNCMTAAEQH